MNETDVWRVQHREVSDRMTALRAAVIFCDPVEASASPIVSLSWGGPPSDLYRQVWTAAHWGSDPNEVCAKFVAWCVSQPGAVPFVRSLPGVPWGGFQTDAEISEWYDRMVAEAAQWDSPALMADLNGGPVTQGGLVRWPRPGLDKVIGDPA